MAFPPDERPPSAREAFADAIDLLRSDRSRGFAIDIETDTMVFEDQRFERSARVEFITAVSQFMQQAVPAAQLYPDLRPILMKMLMLGVRGFKAGRDLEQAFEQAEEQWSEAPPPQQKPDPKAEEAKARLEADKAKMMLEQEAMKARLAMERERQDADLAHEAKKIDLQEAALNLKAMNDQARAKQDFALKVAAQNKQVLSEASEGMNEQPVSMEPLVAVMDGIRQLVGVVAQAQAQQAQQFAQLAELIAAPKRIVRGRDGRAEGVQTVALQ